MTALDAVGEHWPRINALLDQALAMPPAERERWVDALDSEADGVRQTLRELLAVHASVETDDFLHSLPCLDVPPRAAVASDEPAAGDRVGPYRLLRELGRGGMGAVWLAERADGQLKRQVALKLPRLAWGAALTERLARERDILAQLTHPYIARLYDAGVDALGRPWLAIEYVEGRPIDVHCREFGLDTRARVRLLLDVAGAVAYAHGKQVLHRDLKPSNILVTRDGQVRLLDFGIAKLMRDDRASETALTHAHGRALTPEYASPEQVRGVALSVASDVYSLGVVAYELLSGSKPYRLKRGSAAELEEAIVAADPPTASASAGDAASARALRGDIDAILNQALRKDPAHRYASVDALAADWRRHLHGERVHARSDTLAYRAMRVARRHRASLAAAAVVAGAFVLALGFGATALVIGALLVGLAVSAWQAKRAREQAQIARTEARTAEAVQAFLEGIFSANSADQPDPLQARQRTARELLDEGAARIESQLDDVPHAKLRVLRTLARLYDEMGERDAQERMLRLRVDVAQRAFGERSLEVARALVLHGETLIESANDARAISSLTRAEAIFGQHADVPDPDRLALDLALANYYRMRGDVRGIEPARRVVERLRQRQPSQQTVRALVTLGSLEQLEENYDRAADAAREALILARQLPAGGRTMLPLLQLGLANAESARGQADEAEALLRDGLATAESLEGKDSNSAVLMQGWLAQFLYRHDRNRESLDLLADAERRTAGWTDVAEQVSVRILLLLMQGYARRQFGQPLLALECLDRALALGAQVDENPRIEAWVRLARVHALLASGQPEAAASALDAADEYLGSHAMDARKMLVDSQRSRVQLLLAQGRVREAEAAWQRWLPKRSGFDIEREADRAEIALALGDLADAEVRSADSLLWLDRNPTVEGAARHRMQLLLVRGAALLTQQRFVAAAAPLNSALDIAQQIADPDSSTDRLRSAALLGWARLHTGDPTAAGELLSIAREIASQHRALPPNCSECLQALQSALDPMR